MPRIGSISRMMIAMALIGVDLALIRSWVPPPGVWNFETARYLGEIGPMTSLALIGLAVAFLVEGRWRRFGVGVALSALSLASVVFLAPTTIRHAIRDATVTPLYRSGLLPRFLLPDSYRLRYCFNIPEYAFEGLVADSSGGHYWIGFTRCPFVMPDDPIVLGLIELPLALAGGLLALLRNSRSGRACPADDAEAAGQVLPDESRA